MSPDAIGSAPQRRSVLILVAIAAAIYVGSAARPALLDDADGCHALAAREILQRHDWTVLHINGIRWLEKPPLHYWLVAASYAALGESAFTTRLPIALTMVALTLLLYEFGRRFFDERTGFYAGLVMATSVGAFLFTRIMIPEALYALEFTAAFYLFLRGWTGALPPRLACWGTAAVIGLATLTRAGIGGLFPLAIIGAFLIAAGAWRRDSEARRRFARLPLWSSALVALAVALPWHIAASLRTQGFLWFYFVNEQVLRALGRRYPPDYTAVPLAIWWAAHIIWFFPWAIYLPLVGREIRALLRRDRIADAAAAALLLVVIWAAVIFLFFSFVTGSRMEYYSFGAWPAVALLAGLGLARAEARSDPRLTWLQGALAVVAASFAAVLAALLWVSRDVSGGGDIAGLMTRHDPDFYRVSMATLFDLTPQAFARLRVPAAVAAAAFLTGPALAWMLRRRGRAWASTLVVALTMTVFSYAANQAFQVFEPRLSSRPLAVEVGRLLTPEDRVVVYGEFEQACSFSFYTARQALIYNGRDNNGLHFGSTFADAPKIFLDDQQFAGLWRSPGRVFLFVPPEQRAAAAARLASAGAVLVAESGTKAVYANHPLGSSAGHLYRFPMREH